MKSSQNLQNQKLRICRWITQTQSSTYARIRYIFNSGPYMKLCISVRHQIKVSRTSVDVLCNSLNVNKLITKIRFSLQYCSSNFVLSFVTNKKKIKSSQNLRNQFFWIRCWITQTQSSTYARIRYIFNSGPYMKLRISVRHQIYEIQVVQIDFRI